MAETKYMYSLADDFPNGKISSDRLVQEISASTIVTALARIDTGGDLVEIWFKDALGLADAATLDGLVGAHSGEPIEQQTYDSYGNQMVRLVGSDTLVGMQAVQVLNMPDHAMVLMRSYQLTVPALTTLIKDIHLDNSMSGPTGRCYMSGGEYRVRPTNGHGAAEGSAIHLAIVDRDDVLGLFGAYGLERTKLRNLTNILNGPIQITDTVAGVTSGRVAKVLAINGATLDVEYAGGPFQDGETLTFSGGATAKLGTWDEGDVIEVVRNIRDEWIEDYDQRTYAPGGSREIPKGMYIRVICYNAHATDQLRVKASFTVGRA